MQQVDPDPGQPGPVHDRRDRFRWCGRAGVVPAPAYQGDQLMLGDVRFHRRDIDELPPGHAGLDHARQAVPAPGAHGRDMPDHHVRIREAFQSDTVLAFRPSRTPARAPSQRLRRRFDQTVRRRRPRRVRRRLLQPRLEIRDPGESLLQQDSQLRDLRHQLVIRRRRRGGHDRSTYQPPQQTVEPPDPPIQLRSDICSSAISGRRLPSPPPTVTVAPAASITLLCAAGRTRPRRSTVSGAASRSSRNRTEFLRQVLPADPGLQHEQNALQTLPVRDRAPAPSPATTAATAPLTPTTRHQRSTPYSQPVPNEPIITA